jgi:transposase
VGATRSLHYAKELAMRYVGLDVHKRFARFCILDQAGGPVGGGEVSCEREELTRFAREQLRPDDCVALEASTNTWAVVDLISPHVGRVVVSNPLRTKAIAQAKIKTDKIDAKVLAHLLRCDYLPEVWEPDVQTRRLRQLVTLRTSLIGDRTRIKNRIQSILASRLIRCPYSSLFAKRSIEWLRLLSLDEEDRLMVDGELRLLEGVQREIAEVDRRLQAIAHEEQRVRLLMTLPGVSHTTAVALVGALGDVSRFQDGDHAASYLGLVPKTRLSGDKCFHGRITKTGNTSARWMLTQGVQHPAGNAGPLGAFFRRIARRRGRQVAVVATARKLVVIAYLMLKSNEPYRYADPDLVDRKSRRIRKSAGEAVPRRRTRPRYAEICRDARLPAPRRFDELLAGEQRMLVDCGADGLVERVLGEPDAP